MYGIGPMPRDMPKKAIWARKGGKRRVAGRRSAVGATGPGR